MATRQRIGANCIDVITTGLKLAHDLTCTVETTGIASHRVAAADSEHGLIL
jgi:hypothetical protein